LDRRSEAQEDRWTAQSVPAEKCESCRRLAADVAVNYRTEDFVAATAGMVRPVIDSAFPLRQAAAAHARIGIQCSYRQDRAGSRCPQYSLII